MAEKSLNDPLEGAEIKEIILQEIAKRLDGDSTLLDDIAYAGFTAKFDIKISFLRSLTKPTDVWGGVDQMPKGDLPDDIEHKEIEIHDAHTSNPSPDLERQEHDLPIPVMMATPSGNERRKVHIERPEGRRRGRPPKVRD